MAEAKAKATAIVDLQQAMQRAFSRSDVKAVGSSTVDKLIGIFQSNPPARGTKETLAIYTQMPWLRATIDKIGSSTATATWRVFVRAKQDAKGVRRPVPYKQLQFMNRADRTAEMLRLKQIGELVEIEEHPLIDTLYATGPTFTGYTTRELTQKWLDLVGEAFWIKERNETGMPMNFVPVPPTWVTNTPSLEKNFYEIQTPSGSIDYVVPEDMIWFYHPDPADPYSRGSGMGFTLGDELETDEYASKFMKTFFFNSARPDVLVSSSELKKEDTERLERRWLDKLRGWQRSFLPFFMNREVKVHQLGTDYSHLSMLELRKWERDTVIQAYGVPPEVMGIVEASNRATSEVAEYLYARWVLTPRLEFIRQILQHHLVPDYDDRLILDYDSPVAQDKEYLLKVATIAPWSLSMDEWRELQGKLPIPDGYGKVYAKPLNYEFITELDLLNPPSQQPVEEPEEDPPEDDEPMDDEDPPEDEEDPPEDPPPEEDGKTVRYSWPELVSNVVSRQRIAPGIGTRKDQIMRRLGFALEEIADNARKMRSHIERLIADQDFNAAFELILQPIATREALAPVVAKLTPVYVTAAELAASTLNLFVEDGSDIDGLEPLYELSRSQTQAEDSIVESLMNTLCAIGGNGEDPEEMTYLLIDGLAVGEDGVAEYFEYRDKSGTTDRLVAKFIEGMADHVITHMCNGAQEALWSEAVRNGILDPNKVARLWITRLDCRSCMECSGMDGKTTGIDDSWNLPEDGSVVTPTEAHSQCHCTERLVRKEVLK